MHAIKTQTEKTNSQASKQTRKQTRKQANKQENKRGSRKTGEGSVIFAPELNKSRKQQLQGERQRRRLHSDNDCMLPE
eukprot:17068-Hanusia_phi.AAC.1